MTWAELGVKGGSLATLFWTVSISERRHLGRLPKGSYRNLILKKTIAHNSFLVTSSDVKTDRQADVSSRCQNRQTGRRQLK